MIKKISLSFIFVCLLIAIPLALLGYKKVELGSPFLALMANTTRQLEGYKVTIPDIPMIPAFEEPEGIMVVVQFLLKVVNGISTLLNVIIMLLNSLIQLLEFIFLLLKNLISFKDSIQPVEV